MKWTVTRSVARLSNSLARIPVHAAAAVVALGGTVDASAEIKAKIEAIKLASAAALDPMGAELARLEKLQASGVMGAVESRETDEKVKDIKVRMEAVAKAADDELKPLFKQLAALSAIVSDNGAGGGESGATPEAAAIPGGKPIVRGLFAKMRAETKTVIAELAVAERAAVTSRQAVQSFIDLGMRTKDIELSDSLGSGAAASILVAWWKIVVYDANSPDLRLLEVYLKQFSAMGSDWSFLFTIKAALRRVQQQNRAARGPGSNGALSPEQIAGISQYSGGSFG